jgi:parvulin-like peptidyl-prolyl isomerase
VPEARVRHILLSTQEGKSEDVQKQLADSLLAVVKKDRSKFEDLVTKFSNDPGSVSTGGVYEWFDKQRMVPEFTAASFDQKVGAITIAKTSYGFHIVEVLGQRTRQEPAARHEAIAGHLQGGVQEGQRLLAPEQDRGGHEGRC